MKTREQLISELEELKKNERPIEESLKDIEELWKIKKIDSEIIWEKLTPRQEKFCQLYTTDTSCFWNWVTTYLEVYDVDTTKPHWYKNACSLASRLTSNAKVYNRINELLEEQGLNDEFADKQMLFIMSQHTDLSNKLWAIREYNRLKQRVLKKIELDIYWWDILKDIQTGKITKENAYELLSKIRE